MDYYEEVIMKHYKEPFFHYEMEKAKRDLAPFCGPEVIYTVIHKRIMLINSFSSIP